MIDTHAHLDALDDPGDAVARARAAGVDRIVAIASGLESARVTRTIAAANDGVAVAAGVHPHQAADGEDAGAAVAVAGDVVAIGEIGLDYYRDYAPRDDQRRVFAEQLDLATELGKPVVIHCHSAEDEMAAMLAGFDGAVVLHCFSTPELLPVALERSYYVSFAGNVTYPKAHALRDSARHVPADRLLAETDSPYLSPQPVRGKTNEPANVVHTIAALAEVRGDDPGELSARLDANASVVFALP